MTRFVIIGNGAAGVSAAETIRLHDPQSAITILTAEPYRMYSRPGLAYIVTNTIAPHQVVARTAAWYKERQIALIQARAERLDTEGQMVFLEDSRSLAYDRLLIATGARAVWPPYVDPAMKGVVFLDTLDGTKALMRAARRARRGVVIGGGITALELTEGFVHQRVDTHYFLRGDRLWSRVFTQAEGQILAHHMQAEGVTLHYHTEVEALIDNWRHHLRAVRLKNGREFRCDLFGVGIGVRPQLDLVAKTPIKTDRAILVNEYLESSVANVFAAGDVAQVYDRWSERHLLDILWPSAVEEGRAAGLNMMGQQTAYQKGIPFNACLLFGLHITIIGQINPDPEEGSGLEQTELWSRGSSDVWYTFPRSYKSAWASEGDNSLRLVLDGSQIVGAVVMGNQSVADPLRALIEAGVDASPLLPFLEADRDTLALKIQTLWQETIQSKAGT